MLSVSDLSIESKGTIATGWTKAEFESGQDKPKPLPVKPEGIQAGLKLRRQWVCWDYIPKEGKWTKVPITPATGVWAKSNDPSTWDTFEKAYDAYLEKGYAGVGFMFQEGGQLVGIDFDKCRRPESGRLHKLVKKLIKKANTYTEVSPSGTGVKLLAVGKLSQLRGNRRGLVEMYMTAEGSSH